MGFTALFEGLSFLAISKTRGSVQNAWAAELSASFLDLLSFEFRFLPKDGKEETSLVS